MRIDLRALIIAALIVLGACSATPTESELATAVAELAAQATLTAASRPTTSPTPTDPSLATSTSRLAASATVSSEALLTGPHPDGVYQVGVNIAAGVWRAIPPNPQLGRDRFCYWARRKYDGIVLGSHYGPEAGEILIRPGDYEVEFDGCGVWVYMGGR